MKRIQDYPTTAKHWRVVKEPDGYFYELSLGKLVVDRFKIPEDSKLNMMVKI